MMTNHKATKQDTIITIHRLLGIIDILDTIETYDDAAHSAKHQNSIDCLWLEIESLISAHNLKDHFDGVRRNQ